MIDGSEKRNRQFAFELQNSHVCWKSAVILRLLLFSLSWVILPDMAYFSFAVLFMITQYTGVITAFYVL